MAISRICGRETYRFHSSRGVSGISAFWISRRSVDFLCDFLHLLIGQNVFSAEPEEGSDQESDRYQRHDHAQTHLCGGGHIEREIRHLVGFADGGVAQVEDGERDGGNQDSQARGELDDKGLHGKDHRFITAVILHLPVIDGVGEENGHQNIVHPGGCHHQNAGDQKERQHHQPAAGKDQKDQVSDDSHGHRDVEDPDGGEKPPQERIQRHHGQNLRRAGRHVEQRVAVVPAGTAEVVLEEVDQKIGGDVHRRVDQDDRENDGHRLVIPDQRAEHLADGNGLHFRGGVLVDAEDGEGDTDDKQNRHPQGKIAEAEELRLPGTGAAGHCSDGVNCRHGEDCHDGGADAGAGAGERGQVFPLLSSPGERRDHRPVRDIHHGIGDAPENVENRGIGNHATAIQRRRAGKHQKQNSSVGQRSDQKPGAEPSHLCPGVCDDHAHDRVVQGVENPGSQQNDPHGNGIDAEDVLIVVEDIACRKHVDHVFSDGTRPVGDFLPAGECGGSAPFLSVCHFSLLWIVPALISDLNGDFCPSASAVKSPAAPYIVPNCRDPSLYSVSDGRIGRTGSGSA